MAEGELLMGFGELLDAKRRLDALCPACRSAALAAAKRIETECHSGKHRKAKGVLLQGPPQ